LFPRKLIRARKGLALERTEAALFVWLWARQVGLDAGWALARPAPLGPGGPVSPAGFTHALVLMAIDGQTRWIDPSCRVCAPFELPPDLEGADVLSKWAEATPQPTPGSMTVEHGEQGQSRIHLEGSAALSLRLADEPSASLGAAIVEQTGMEEPGAGIDLVVEGSPDPLAIDVVVPWVGTRVLRRRGETVPFEAATALLSYARTQDEDGWIEERLTVQSRTLTPEALRALQDFRSAPPEAAQPDAQAPAPDQEQDEPADDEREEL
jgi:hypothetical protein